MKELIGADDIEVASPAIKIEVDVDGLIAEIESRKFPEADDDWTMYHNNTHDNIIKIIRKHFGKE